MTTGSPHTVRLGSAVGVIALALAAVAVAEVPRAGDPDERGLYRRPLGHDPATLDPARIRDVYGVAVAQQVFDGLVQFGATGAVAPALAQFWRASRDGLSWSFTLKKGVRFHHGREVTADDVVYSFARILDPRTRSGAADLFAHVKGAQEFRDGRARHVAGLLALDRYTVQVTLNEPYAPFVAALAEGHAKIVPREVVEREGEKFGTRPVGTGPFRFVSWNRGTEIVLEANPEYHDGPPSLSRVVYRIFPGNDVAAMYQEFRHGRLEDTPIPPEHLREAMASSALHYVRRPMLSLRFYGFNLRLRPLDDRRVRRALVHAVDRPALVQEAGLGRHVFAHGILPPGTGYDPRVKGLAYDPPRARELLAEAGYPGGRGLPTLVVWSSVKGQMLLEHDLMRRHLEAVGVKVEFRYETDWPTFSQMLADGTPPVFLYAWYADVPDPDNFLFKLFHSRGSRNYVGYANPTVDDLLGRARTAQDLPRRIELYRQAETIILDDAPVMPILHHAYDRLFQRYVRDVEVNELGDSYIPLRRIRLERRR